MNLVITDSGQKALTLGAVARRLPDRENWSVVPATGFDMDFPKKGIGIDFDLREPRLVVSNKTVLTKVLQSVSDVHAVYLFINNDRAGEGLAGHLRRNILDHFPEKPVKRLSVREVTLPGFQEAVASAYDIHPKAFDAYLAGRIIDRLIQYRLGKITGHRIGRAMTPAVAFASREPSSLYRVVANYDGTILSSVFADEAVCRNTAHILETTTVEPDLEVADVPSYPPTPFDSTSLLTVGIDLLRSKGISILSIARQLYEGGLITDPFNAGTSVSPEFYALVAARVKSLAGPAFVGRHVVGSDRECVRPTDIFRDPSQVAKHLQPLYRLIWARTIASCSVPAKVRRRSARLRLDTELTGSAYSVIEPGHIRVGLGIFSEKESTFPTQFVRPVVSVEAQTPNVNEAILLHEFAQKRIPANASIVLKAAENNGYIEFDGLNVAVTQSGMTMLEKIAQVAPEMIGLGFLVESERRLDLIASGKEAKNDIIDDYVEWSEQWQKGRSDD